MTGHAFNSQEPIGVIKNYEKSDEYDYVPLSLLQYIPDLEEIKDEHREKGLHDFIYVSPAEKFKYIRQYLNYFQDMTFGDYIKPMKLRFDTESLESRYVMDFPELEFGAGYVLQNIPEKFNELNKRKISSLKQHGCYKPPILDEIIIIRRASFDNEIANKLRISILKELELYKLNKTQSDIIIETFPEELDALDKKLRKKDWNNARVYVPIIDDVRVKYEDVKNILNRNDIPSQMVREDTLRNSNDSVGTYNGIVQNIVFGLITKSEGTPWILHKKLSSSLIIGIESEYNEGKKTWGSAFIFDEYGKRVRIPSKNYRGTDDFKHLILDSAYEKMREMGSNYKINGITIHRDGFLTKMEKDGLMKAISELRLKGNLADGFYCVSVNIKKSSNYRMFDRNESGIINPKIGSYFIIDDKNALMAATGYPFLSKLSVKPLLIEIIDIEGHQDVIGVLKDVFALSELNWGSPRGEIKLPITLYYSDKMLEIDDLENKPSYLPV